MTGYPCCCDPCCITTKTLAMDVTIGSLPGMTEVLKEPIGTCKASTNGIYDDGTGDETQSLGEWERPTTAIEKAPKAGINALMAGEYINQEYTSIITDLVVTDEYGQIIECYYIQSVPSLSNENSLLAISTDITGTLSLLTGNEPLAWPYYIKLEYMVYTDGSGDCILRVAAVIRPRATQVINETPALPTRVLYQGKQALSGGGTWSNTTTVFKYSDFNPCAEDLGFSAGAWVSGTNVLLLDGPVNATTGVIGTGANGLYTSGDLTQADEGTSPVSDPTPSSPFLGLLWEINLTTSGVTDLASLPSTPLDTTNIIGVMDTEDIEGSYTPVGSLPGSYFSQEWNFYDPLSTRIDPASILRQTLVADAPLDYEILNDGLGGHICGTQSAVTECTRKAGHPYDGGGFLQVDKPYWEITSQVLQSMFQVAWNTISFTLKPATP